MHRYHSTIVRERREETIIYILLQGPVGRYASLPVKIGCNVDVGVVCPWQNTNTSVSAEKQVDEVQESEEWQWSQDKTTEDNGKSEEQIRSRKHQEWKKTTKDETGELRNTGVTKTEWKKYYVTVNLIQPRTEWVKEGWDKKRDEKRKARDEREMRLWTSAARERSYDA